MTSINHALEMLEGCGPEFGAIGLSNHGPMAAEALISLGRGEAIESWTENYRKRLAERPANASPVSSAAWRESLGDILRVSDWEDFFTAQVDSAPWRDVLETWIPRLAPGMMAGATHGLIRTAHAVRSLASDESDSARIAELVSGLAYWAARYQVMPGSPGPTVPALASEALPRIPIMPPELRNPRATTIFRAVAELDDYPPFGPVINMAAPGDDLSAWISDLTSVMANAYLQNSGVARIAYVHTVTAPSALRMLVPHVSDQVARVAARYAWQACAAIHSRSHDPHDFQLPDTAPTREELIDRCVFSGDEHAIKFTEACLREYALNPDPVFLAGPLEISDRYSRKVRGNQD